MTTHHSEITGPGFYDLPAAVYHSDPYKGGTLSQSETKILLDEGGPAKYRAQQDLPREEKNEWDLGTAAHALILGKGEEQLVVHQYEDYRTKDAREARDAAYEAGKTPLKPQEWEATKALADAVPGHIRQLFTGGVAEQAMFWRHTTGQHLRGQMDYWVPGSYIADLKTINDSSMRSIEADVWRLRYYYQAAFYRRGVHALTGDWLPYFIVFVEKKAPFLSRVVEVTDDYLAVGEAHMDKALAIHAECTATGEWPGHSDTVHQLLPPPWAANAVADATIAALEDLIGETNE